MMGILLVVVMVAVAVTLVVGVIVMMRSGAKNRERSNKLMKLRVGLQALALLMLGVMFLASS